MNTVLRRNNLFYPIEKQIKQVEAQMRSRTGGHIEEISNAIDHLIDSGGKRIRPAVALLVGKMLGADQERLIALSAAIELLHTATLVHDDLIDGALMRRGIATLNTKWSPAATVLTGDYIFAQAAKFAASTKSVLLMHLFSETLATIVNGELTQLFYSRSSINKDDYFKRIYAKTASLFELASQAAAILSPVDEKVIQNMKQFGYEIGMAFQIVDDILDFTGEQNTIGKPVASDLRQGLITLPTLYFLEIQPENPDIKKIINGDISQVEDIDGLISSIRTSGSIENSLNEAKEYINKALERLSDQSDSDEKNALLDLARYIIDRPM